MTLPFWLNVLVCAALLGVMIYWVVVIVRRNKKIIVKGKDDFVWPMAILICILVAFPFSEKTTVIEALRNSLMYMAVIESMMVKRGISDKGFELFLTTLPWDQVKTVKLIPYQMNTINVICEKSTGEEKLIFKTYRIADILRETQKHVKNIKIEESLEKRIMNNEFKPHN